MIRMKLESAMVKVSIIFLVLMGSVTCSTFTVIEENQRIYTGSEDLRLSFSQILDPMQRLVKAIALTGSDYYRNHQEELSEIIKSAYKSILADSDVESTEAETMPQTVRNIQLLQEFFPAFIEEPTIANENTGPELYINDLLSKEIPMALKAYKVKEIVYTSGGDNTWETIFENNFQGLQQLATELSDYELAELIGGDLVDATAPGNPAQSVLQASVTVWVDRGTRIERGMGLPDQVVGSGFFIDPEGYILTNYHVISSQVDPKYQGVSRLYIKPYSSLKNSQYRIPARVVGYDEVLDLALLKTEFDPPGVISLDFTAEFDPGESMFAVGSPGGLESSLSLGIVSALGRRFLQIGEVTQVDMPINPGNSGGPIFERSGRVAGVVFAGIEQFEGVNFAIPARWIFPIYGQLFSEGQVQYPWAGLSVHGQGSTVLINFIDPLGPASYLPVNVGDQILEINGKSVGNVPEIQFLITKMKVNDVIVIKIKKPDGSLVNLPLILDKRPTVPFERLLTTSRFLQSWFLPLFGLQVENIGGLSRREFSIKKVNPNGLAESAGISEHDRFELVNWIYMEEDGVAAIQIRINRRDKAYVDEILQLATYISINSFI